MTANLLQISSLAVSVGDTPILRGIDLSVGDGQVHAIMGPNGAGKSTLTRTLAGHEQYTVTAGDIRLGERDLAPLSTEERAHAGLFIGFQYPVEVPGVSNREFLRLALNAHRRARGEEELSAADFEPIVNEKVEQTGTDPSFLDRDLNAGFSGGQKKRNELLQLYVLEPTVAILDETDSGLDIDALRAVAAGIEAYRGAGRAIVLITHYQRLLDLVKPDRVHVLAAGRIVRSGGPELALELEEQGYDWLTP